ncbi:MAG: SGNH/GDSL hydrolase family protein [Myxococcota bacterium]
MKRALAALVLAALALAGLEAGARRLDVPDPALPSASASKDGIMLHGNPWLLWELVPGEHVEQGVSVRVNAQGFRDGVRGAKTGRRALALGDSSVYGFGVADEDVFTAVLERSTGDEFVNAAVPGHSSFQQLNLLLMRGLALDPDLLVVATLWSDNNFDSFTDRDLLTDYAGWEASWQQAARRRLERLALFRALDWHLRVRPQGDRARKVGWILGGDDPRTGKRRVAIADYAGNLDAFCRIMAERDGGVVFVVLPNQEDVRSPPPDPAWGPYRRVMRETAARWQAPLVDLPAAFRATGLGVRDLFLDEMHPTTAGHRLMAEAVAAALAGGWPTLGSPSGPVPAYEDRFDGTGFEVGDPRAPGPLPVTPGSAPVPPGPVAPGADASPAVAEGPALHGYLRVPQRHAGRVVLDFTVPGRAGNLGSESLSGDGPVRVRVRELPAHVVVRATLDVAGNGPNKGDLFASLPAQEVPPDGKLLLDFSAARFVGF